jgi:hypothetical protein
MPCKNLKLLFPNVIARNVQLTIIHGKLCNKGFETGNRIYVHLFETMQLTGAD